MRILKIIFEKINYGTILCNINLSVLLVANHTMSISIFLLLFKMFFFFDNFQWPLKNNKFWLNFNPGMIPTKVFFEHFDLV